MYKAIYLFPDPSDHGSRSSVGELRPSLSGSSCGLNRLRGEAYTAAKHATSTAINFKLLVSMVCVYLKNTPKYCETKIYNNVPSMRNSEQC